MPQCAPPNDPRVESRICDCRYRIRRCRPQRQPLHFLRSQPLATFADESLVRIESQYLKTLSNQCERLSPATCGGDHHLRLRREMRFDRIALLSAFAQRSGSRIVAVNGAIALVRDGRTARHVGPLFADDAAAALALVDAIVRSETSPLLLDAVASQGVFLAGLTAGGWTVERPFQRMRFGPATVTAEEMPFAVAGPEFG